MREYHARYSEPKVLFPFGAECWKNARKRSRARDTNGCIFQATRIENRRPLRENEAVCVTLITEARRVRMVNDKILPSARRGRNDMVLRTKNTCYRLTLRPLHVGTFPYNMNLLPRN